MRIFGLFIIILLINLIQPANASTIEDEVSDTVNQVNKSRDSGANVNDLVDRINDVLFILDGCGWNNCPNSILHEVYLELDMIKIDAKKRTRSNNYWLPILLGLLIIIIILEKKFSIVHRFRWQIMKNRRIKY